MAHIAVIGGGITGLTAAYDLMRNSEGIPPQVTVIEAGDRLGGKIRTEPFVGLEVDLGAEALVAWVPAARALCRELGLEEALEVPATSKAYLWTRGRLRAAPDGLVYGVPTSVSAVARSGALSFRGLARAGLDILAPRQPLPPDPSVMQVIGSRVGREVVERLVEPLLGGIYAGRADHLSLEAVAPSLAAAAKQRRSLILGLASLRPDRATPSSPMLVSITGGMKRLIERLRQALVGVTVRTGTQVRAIVPLPDGRYQVQCEPGPPLVVDGALLTAPSWAVAEMTQRMAPALAARLASIAYASVVTVTFGFAASALPRPFDGSGFLVPRVDGRLLTACTWCTNKWPYFQRSPLLIVRCSAGRYGDIRALELADDALAERLQGELAQATGLSGPPAARVVMRWERAIPQYEPGHHARVAEIESALASWPGMILAGAPYHGMGIASCIQDAARAAAQMRAHLATRSLSVAEGSSRSREGHDADGAV